MRLLQVSVEGGVTYPYSLSRLRRENPDKSFPRSPSEDMLAEHGVYPVVQTSQPDGDIVTEGRPELVDGQWVQQWVVEDFSLDELKDKLHQENTSKRVQTLAAGISYDFPDGAGTVQTRNPTDIGNINGVASMGTVLAGNGVTDAVLSFRDAENVTHPLTPTQAQAFGSAIGQAISAIYETKWSVGAQIDALVTAAECRAFDIDAAWSS